MYMQHSKKHHGFLLIGVLVFAGIAMVTVVSFVTWGITSSQLARRVLHREQSLEIAEAGIEYARWYLAHYQNDFQLGTGDPGPYEFDFEDKNGNVIGTYTLGITPPPTGSTLVVIESTGVVTSEPVASRTIRVKIAIPSLAKYSVLSNNDIRFGEGTVVYGPVHSNGGIRFDGTAYNEVTSAKTSYDDPDHSGGNEFGVHTHLNKSGGGTNSSFRPAEAPPSTVEERTDVFKAGREFPVPAVDFAGIASDLATIKTEAQASGHYFAASGASGYQLILKTDDTFDVYRVTGLVSPPNHCTNINNEDGWGTWSISTKAFVANYALPSNGLIFIEDDAWVEGEVNGARLTIAAARFPDNASTRKSITVNNDLTYTNYDGTDVIALIAQKNINVGLISEDNLQIDAALIAQNGRVGRYYYRPAGSSQNRCAPNHTKTLLTLFGTIASNLRYGFAFTDGTGYTTRTITYDTNLLYSPPPNFPLASDKYQIISWEELEE